MDESRIVNDKFGELSVNDDGGGQDNNLSKVIKAVEAAEAIIRQQEKESNRLKAELLKRDQELEHLVKVDKSVAQRYYPIVSSDEHRLEVDSNYQTSFRHDPFRSLILNQTFAPKTFFSQEGQSGDSWNSGNLNTLSGGQIEENASFSHILPSTSFLPGRYPKNGDYEPRVSVPAQGVTPVAETNNHNHLSKQAREREEEIIKLQKQLTEFSIKEAQIRDEKHVLEKRIAHLRMAFDQKQQDVVDAASKALSYRQDIIEENVRLTYALQNAQQERTTFVSSLLALLAEYSLQPQVSDAQSIVGNIKVLFKHLQEKLIITEGKLQEFQYQLRPWQPSGMSPNFVPQSPVPQSPVPQSPEHSSGAALTSVLS